VNIKREPFIIPKNNPDYLSIMAICLDIKTAYITYIKGIKFLLRDRLVLQGFFGMFAYVSALTNVAPNFYRSIIWR
jgi:hypothetical protein